MKHSPYFVVNMRNLTTRGEKLTNKLGIQQCKKSLRTWCLNWKRAFSVSSLTWALKKSSKYLHQVLGAFFRINFEFISIPGFCFRKQKSRKSSPDLTTRHQSIGCWTAWTSARTRDTSSRPTKPSQRNDGSSSWEHRWRKYQILLNGLVMSVALHIAHTYALRTRNVPLSKWSCYT